jgi:hypothetical protein
VASTQEAASLTGTYQLSQRQLSRLVISEQLLLWNTLNLSAVDATRDSWLTASMSSVEKYRSASTAQAADYYWRFASAEGVPRELAPMSSWWNRDRARAGLEINGPVRFKTLMARGYPFARAGQIAAVSVAGEAVRFALEGGRDELLGQVKRDRAALGWQRVGGADPCAFCAMLISRGPVYTKSSATFEAHASCGCTAEPVFNTNATTDQSKQFKELWNVSQQAQVVDGLSTDPLNRFRRFYEGRVVPAA